MTCTFPLPHQTRLFAVYLVVASHEDPCLYNYGDEVSGFDVLWNRLNPFAKKRKYGDMNEISSRLAYIKNSINLAEVRMLLLHVHAWILVS
jgi:hypothetical protein